MKLLCTLVSIAAINFVFGQTYAIVADRLIDCKNEKAVDNPTIIIRGKTLSI